MAELCDDNDENKSDENEFENGLNLGAQLSAS
jgi:hypothetical protein